MNEIVFWDWINSISKINKVTWFWFIDVTLKQWFTEIECIQSITFHDFDCGLAIDHEKNYLNLAMIDTYTLFALILCEKLLFA